MSLRSIFGLLLPALIFASGCSLRIPPTVPKAKPPEAAQPAQTAPIAKPALPPIIYSDYIPRTEAGIYPDPITPSPWLQTHQRLSFAVDGKNMDQVVAQGANVLIGGTNAGGPGFAGGPYGLSEDGKIINVATGVPLTNDELATIKQRVDKAHSQGLKVMGEATRMYHGDLLTVAHPDWQELPGTTATATLTKPGEWKEVIGCWNSPFGEYFIKETVALTQQLGWDGYNLDGFGCWTQCRCPHCTESYKKFSGKGIPTDQNLNDPEFRHYLKWRLRRYTDFVSRWTAALKAVKPDFAACPWSTGPGRWWHWSFAPFAEGSDAMHRVLDAPMLEMLWDFPPDQGSNLMPSFTVRYYRGLTGDRPPFMLPYYCTQGQWPMQSPAVESDFRLLTCLTNGALVAQGVWQQTKYIKLDHFMNLIKEREKWTTNAKSRKWAAIFMSESSRLLYGVPGKRSELKIGQWIGSGVDSPESGSLPPGERRLPEHMESAVGVFRALEEDHVPVDMITEQDIEEGKILSDYKVIVLPNTACISEPGLKNIRAFVNNGGGLVAMHESSLCDEFGTRRENFGLSDLFGATYKGAEDYSARWPNYEKNTMLFLDQHAITSDTVIADNYRYDLDRLNYIGWTTNVEVAADAKQIGKRLQKTEWPFLVLSDRGKGKVAYYAADLGQAYFIAPYQYERKLLSNAVRWAAGENTPPIEVTAPLCVQAAFYTQNDGKRQVVHLLNEINTTANRSLPENNPPMREDTVPVHDIRVRFADAGLKTFWQEPEHIKLKSKKIAGGTEVVVPKLTLHSMIVAE